jgi:hypothetical protein
MKKFLPILFIFSSCSTWFDKAEGPSLTPQGKAVEVVESVSKDCDFIGEVSEEDWLVGLRKFSIAKARNTAGKMGANKLVITRIGHSQRKAIWGNVYRCPTH